MSGLTWLNKEELPEDLRGVARGETASVVQVFGHNAPLLRSWLGWYGAIMRDGAVPMKLKEIVRLRLATLNGCGL